MRSLDHIAILLVVLGTLTAGCVAERTTGSVVEYAVTGYVHAGPVCPVEQNPPDPACEDRPVAGAVLLVEDAGGDPFGEIVTDPTGSFETRLPAGSYTLVPQPVEGLLGTAAPQEFTVGSGGAVELDVPYDTGIR